MHITALLICLVGLVLFFAAGNKPDVKETGRIMFAVGLLVTLLRVAETTLRL